MPPSPEPTRPDDTHPPSPPAFCEPTAHAPVPGLAALDGRSTGSRRFGGDADARWKAFQGGLRDWHRIDLLVGDAAVRFPAAFAPRMVFDLPALIYLSAGIAGPPLSAQTRAILESLPPLRRSDFGSTSMRSGSLTCRSALPQALGSALTSRTQVWYVAFQAMAAIISEANVQGLVTVGYLLPNDTSDARKVERALRKFQRHAARPYRLPLPDVGSSNAVPTGVCDPTTEAAIKEWIARGWRNPVGRFKILKINVGGQKPVRLREDAAMAWMELVRLAEGKGATLGGEYGDSARPVRPSAKAGTSRYSFHYCGRAVDICQDYTKSKDHRYYVARDPVGDADYWRIYCRTENQNGSQGVLIRKGEKKHHQFNPHNDVGLPEGYYVDLTSLIESTGKFERIKAQGGWAGNYNKAEWWHFQYKLDKQTTFVDEMELIGVTEQALRLCGWDTDEMLDHKPG